MKYFLAGIKGEGMLELACLFSDLGYEIICYEDSNCSFPELESRNIEVCTNILNLNDDCVVVYSELSQDHRVFLKAKELNLKVYNYDDILEKLMRKFNTICISGLHGKTFIADMLSDVLECNYIIDKKSKGIKESDKLVFEENNLSRNYNPEYIVISSMEMPDNDYKSVDEMIGEYQEYANKASKIVIACGDDSYTHTLNVNTQMFYYGINEDNDITARDIEYSDKGTIFDVYVEGEFYGHFDLPIYGKHMLLDTLAVISICHYERIDSKDVIKKLKEYNSFNEEVKDNNIIIKSKANCEIEIKALIKAIKQKYPEKNIYVCNKNIYEIDGISFIDKNEIKSCNDSIIIKIEG